MKAGISLAFGMVVYAVAVISQAPATLLDASVQHVTNGRIRLAEARGTAWRGEAWIEFRDAARMHAVARRIRWNVLPSSLWRGRLNFVIALEGASRDIAVGMAPAGLTVGGFDLDLPAASLALAESRLRSVGLSGTLLLRSAGLSLQRQGGLTGSVEIDWRRAGSALTPVSPLGSYALHLEGQGQLARFTLATTEGPIDLRGAGNWSIGDRPTYQVTANVPPGYREQMTPLLRLISIQRDEGTFELQMN